MTFEVQGESGWPVLDYNSYILKNQTKRVPRTSLNPSGCSSRQPSPSCLCSAFPSALGPPALSGSREDICKSSLDHDLALGTCGWNSSLLGVCGGGRGGGLKSQTWIDCYRLVATTEKDRQCTPARLAGNRDRMQRCKESEPSRAGLPTQQRKGKLLPGKAIWGRRLQGQAPRKLCQERKKLADGKHRLKKKKNPRGSEQGNG